MKILELGKFYPPYRGGMETLLRIWSEGFVRQGAQVDCVVANETPRTAREELNGVRVHRLASFGTLFSTSLCPGYLRATRHHPADLWHVHFPNPLADVACLRGNRATPLVLTYHSDVIRQAFLMRLYRPLMQRLFERVTRIVVATPNHIEFSPWLGAYRDKCEVIPFGINLEQLKRTDVIAAKAEALRREAGARPIVLTIGRLVGYKGHRYLIAALRQLEATLWLAGAGPLERDLRDQVASLGIGDRVHFWGEVDDEQLPALLHACDVFALPSITPNEAFGLVQVEAMACGKPVVSCALRSGVPFVNQDGVTGLVVPPRDTDALALALKRLFGNDALRARLGEAGRIRACQEFEEQVMLGRYWRLFEQVTAPYTRR